MQAPSLFTLDLTTILRTFWRRRYVILACVFGAIFIMAVWLVQQPKQYSAKAVLQINARDAQVLDIENVLSGLGTEQSALQSEMDLIRSTYLAKRVADALNLYEDPNFNTSLQKPSFLKQLKRKIAGSSPKSGQHIKLAVIDKVLNSYRVYNPARSLTINIATRGFSAEEAANLANTVAQEYLNDQQENSSNATRNANQYLEGRLVELRQQVRQSEEAVQQFMRANNLFQQQGLSLNGQQLSELNTQLIIARTDRAEAEARVQRARQLTRNGDIRSAAEVLNSPLIQRFREQEAEVARKEADLATRYGPKHPEMQKARAEQADLQSKIKQEIINIRAAYENELAIARTRENELSRNLKSVQSEAGLSTAAEVKLAELEREAKANRAVFESFLTRSKETSEQEGLEQVDARIVSKATPALAPSHPKKSLMLILAAILGGLLAVCVVAILEWLDRTFRTAEQVETALDTSVVGQIPLLAAGLHVVDYVLEKPNSVYAEAHRSVRTALHFTNPDHPPQVVLVTSAVANEGKSSFSVTLGCLLAKAGQKILVLDCDLRKPSTANILGLKYTQGLGDVLVGDATLADVILHHKQSGVDVLPAKANTPNSNELLASQKMRNTLETLKKSYDLIILDTPPVSAVADALTLTELADAAVFVTKWGFTPKELSVQALKTLRKTRIRLVGAVLTQVDMQQMKQYSSAYYESYTYAAKYYEN